MACEEEEYKESKQDPKLKDIAMQQLTKQLADIDEKLAKPTEKPIESSESDDEEPQDTHKRFIQEQVIKLGASLPADPQDQQQLVVPISDFKALQDEVAHLRSQVMLQ